MVEVIGMLVAFVPQLEMHRSECHFVRIAALMLLSQVHLLDDLWEEEMLMDLMGCSTGELLAVKQFV